MQSSPVSVKFKGTTPPCDAMRVGPSVDNGGYVRIPEVGVIFEEFHPFFEKVASPGNWVSTLHPIKYILAVA